MDGFEPEGADVGASVATAETAVVDPVAAAVVGVTIVVEAAAVEVEPLDPVDLPPQETSARITIGATTAVATLDLFAIDPAFQ